jgi:hypothetical protein
VARKPENQFAASVHKYLPRDLYKLKMNNPYTSGVADWWFSGRRADLWIEYKYISEIPKRNTTMIIPALSELQRKWVTERRAEGRNVMVIVGCPEGGVVFETPNRWNEGIDAGCFRGWAEERRSLADFITAQVYM